MSPRDLIRQVTEIRAGLVALASLLVAGVVAGLTLAGWVALPQRTSALEAEVSRHDTINARQDRDISDLSRGQTRLLCLAEADALDQDPIGKGCFR